MNASPGWSPHGLAPAPWMDATPHWDEHHAEGHHQHGPGGCHELPCIYGSASYLMWWVKKANVVPLVTQNDDPNTIAALNEPGTRVLFGGQTNGLDFGRFSGVRGTVGGWLPDQFLGWEVSGFVLEQQGINFNVSSPGGTAPVIAIPIFATEPFFPGNPAGETTFNSGFAPSRINVSARSKLWAIDAAGMLNFYSTSNFRLHGLAGFKYLNLRESLSLTDTVDDNVFFPGGQFIIRDEFATKNEFYGGLIGLRTGLTYGIVSLDLTGKVSFGQMRQQLRINGTTTVTNGAFGLPTGISQGGVFAQTSNIGTFSRNAFTAVPEVQAKLSLNLLTNLDLWVAYDFIYINDILRAGNQIDRNVNPTQSSLVQNSGGVFAGAPAPLPGFHSSDFWAQGVSFGITLKY